MNYKLLMLWVFIILILWVLTFYILNLKQPFTESFNNNENDKRYCYVVKSDTDTDSYVNELRESCKGAGGTFCMNDYNYRCTIKSNISCPEGFNIEGDTITQLGDTVTQIEKTKYNLSNIDTDALEYQTDQLLLNYEKINDLQGEIDTVTRKINKTNQETNNLINTAHIFKYVTIIIYHYYFNDLYFCLEFDYLKESGSVIKTTTKQLTKKLNRGSTKSLI